jgi:hypothetical protein
MPYGTDTIRRRQEMYESLDDDDALIDYDQVTELAMNGIKNRKQIAHLLDIDPDIVEQNKEQVDLAIERGHAQLVMNVIAQMRVNAAKGDFQAQKYLLQNLDETWTDKREVVNHNTIDPNSLPSLTDLFRAGVEAGKQSAIESKSDEKEVNPAVDGEFEEC